MILAMMATVWTVVACALALFLGRAIRIADNAR